MFNSSEHRGFDLYSLSDRSLYRWLDQQDTGWYDLPDDKEFARLEYNTKPKRLSGIRSKLSSLLSKRRGYEYKAV